MLKMTSYFKVALFGGMVLVLSLNCDAADGAPLDSVDLKSIFIGVSAGFEYSKFRDFATSPLFYSGTPLYASLAYLESDARRESGFSLAYSVGNYSNTYNGQHSLSGVDEYALHYSELFILDGKSHSHLNVKVGGSLHGRAVYRNNEGLFNNSQGLDVMFNLSGSVKTTWIFNPRHRLSFLLNVVFLNTSYRNGFAYTSSSAPLNTDEFFADYEFKLFSGSYYSSAFEYTLSLNNANALQFSYMWNAYRINAHFENFEKASHTFTFSLLYNLK